MLDVPFVHNLLGALALHYDVEEIINLLFREESVLLLEEGFRGLGFAERPGDAGHPCHVDPQ